MLWLAVAIVLVAGCQTGAGARPGDAAVLPGTAWGVEQIDEVPADRAATTVRFVSDTRVAGRAGCNQYAGALHLGPRTVSIDEALSTRMACEPTVMDQERRFLAALAAVRAFRREADRLLLLDEAARVRLRLVPLP
jgi:heat shock protein HslJ